MLIGTGVSMLISQPPCSGLTQVFKPVDGGLFDGRFSEVGQLNPLFIEMINYIVQIKGARFIRNKAETTQ